MKPSYWIVGEIEDKQARRFRGLKCNFCLMCRSTKSPTGYTLPAFSWYIDQTVGGAVATATHGSTFKWGSLSSQVWPPLKPCHLYLLSRVLSREKYFFSTATGTQLQQIRSGLGTIQSDGVRRTICEDFTCNFMG